jgi:hypothetical protein
VVISYRRFGTTDRSHPQGLRTHILTFQCRYRAVTTVVRRDILTWVNNINYTYKDIMKLTGHSYQFVRHSQVITRRVSPVVYLMLCWTCVMVYQYNETNVMLFSFNVLRIKSVYLYRPLLAHPQESLYKRHLVYCVRIMSVGCGMVCNHTKCRLCSASWGLASNGRYK